jgi:hypothetical protein
VEVFRLTVPIDLSQFNSSFSLISSWKASARRESYELHDETERRRKSALLAASS